MARNYRNVFVAFILSVAVLFIAGILFPKYVSSLSPAFNSSDTKEIPRSLKLASNEKLVSFNSGVGNSRNASQSNFTGANRVIEKFPNGNSLQSTAIDSSQAIVKVKKRSKRSTSSIRAANEFVAWNFNLNVTRYGNITLKKINESDMNTSVGNEHFGVAVYVENKGPQETAFSELQKTLNSVGAFIKNLFTGDIENVTNELRFISEKNISQSFQESLLEKPEYEISQTFKFTDGTKNVIKPKEISESRIIQSPQTSEVETSQNRDMFQFGNDSSRNESLIHKRREGKIFFGIFRSRKQSQEKTTPIIEKEVTKSSDNAETEKNIFEKDEHFVSVLPLGSEFVTENSLQEASFDSDSLVSKIEHPAVDLNAESTSKHTLKKNEISDNVTDGFDLPGFQNETNGISKNLVVETTLTTEPLTDEVLENICNSLLRNLEDSLAFYDCEKHDLDSIQNVKNLTGSSDPPLDFLNFSNSAETDVPLIEDSFNKGNEFTTGSKVLTDEQSRFFNILGFGSGRSSIIQDENDSVSYGQIENLEVINLPSTLDCRRFIDEKRALKILSKLKHVDIKDFKSKFSLNFANSTLPPKLVEQQLQLIDVLIELNSSIQTLDEISRSENNDLKGNGISLANESIFATNKDLFIISKKEKTDSDFIFNDKLATESIEIERGVPQTITEERDGRFVNIWPFVSSSDLQEERNRSDSPWFFGFLGSGGRSLNPDALDESDATSDFESRDSFQETADFSSDGQIFSISDRDSLEDFNTTPVQERRFLNFLGFEGSGIGRELVPENIELNVTEYGPYTDNECGDDCSHNVVEQEYGCEYDCEFEKSRDPINNHSTELNSIPLNESDCRDDCFSYIETLHEIQDDGNLTESVNYDGKSLPEHFHSNFTIGNETYLECEECNSNSLQIYDTLPKASESPFVTETSTSESLTEVTDEYDCNDCNYENLFHETLIPDQRIENSSVHENITMSEILNITENPVEEQKTTELKLRRFMGTIFLTGSGEGGLFGDDGGPINLIEEESTVNPVSVSRRRGRLDDLSVNGLDHLTEVDLFEENLEMDLNNLSSGPFNNSTNHSLIMSVSQSSTVRHKDEETTLKVSNSATETFSSVTFLNTVSTPPDFSTAPTHLKPRPCTGANECNSSLNERCVTIDSSSICDCGRTFVRHKETGKCVVQRQVETSLKLPAEEFDVNLTNPESLKYKQMSKMSIDTMWLLLNETPEILQIVADINVAGFSAGSLIINLNIVLAVENESEAQTIKGMEDTLQKAIQGENLMQKAPLNIRNASLLTITSKLDPCKSTELNYCSKNAYCIWNEAYAGRFACYCKEHYLDDSINTLYPGETCIAKCPPSYCGDYGHCDIMENEERRCLCNGLYFGARCEISGIVVLCSLSVAALITVAILFVVVFRMRCRSSSYGRTPTFRRSEAIDPHPIADGRVSDAIALGEFRGARIGKFLHIGTPARAPPEIKITRPTLDDSNISFDCDSSFDVSSTSAKEETDVRT